MRVVIQRVNSAKVIVDKKVISKITNGYLIYLGLKNDDTKEKVLKIINKIPKLRLFSDEFGKLNKNIIEVNGSCLVVSQFTLYGDVNKNNRPSFTETMPATEAKVLYEYFCFELSKMNIPTKTGQFQADMEVISSNDGPVNIFIEI